MHAVGDGASPFGHIARAIGRRLGIPMSSVTPAYTAEAVWPPGFFVALDGPATAGITRELLGWNPTRPSLLEDLAQEHYYRSVQRGCDC